MEMIFNEAKVREIWSDETFLSVIAGCKHVVVNADTDRTGKHLVVIPARVVFDQWIVELQEDMVRELEKIVDIVALPGKEVEE